MSCFVFRNCHAVANLMFAMLLMVAASVALAKDAAKPAYPTDSLPTSAGGNVALESLRGKKATVLIFASTECPISNGYATTLNRLAKDYLDVRFVGLNPNAGASLRDMEAHRKEFGLTFDMLKDGGAVVAGRLGVKKCPEVCLFDAEGTLRYQGRIDDRYSRRGGAPIEVRRADLEEAIKEVLAGKPVSMPRTETIGCPIDLPSRKPSSTAAVTYSRDIAPLMQAHCQECHRPGGIGPFTLTNYEDALRWADDIRDFTAKKIMPPWKAEAGHGEFTNRRAMAQADIDRIAAWVEAGAPEGNRADLPPLRKFDGSWKHGEPDLVVEMPEEYRLSADGADEYRCFVIPTDFADDQYVVSLEVLPGNARVVHHVLVFVDNTGAAEELDAKHPGPGYPVSGGSPGFFPLGGIGGWAPGNTADKLPAGLAKVLPKGAKLVMQVHYHKSGKPETDRTKVGLHFSKAPVERPVYNITVLPPEGPLGTLRIPAGESNFEVKTTLVLPNDFMLLAITPHMHLLGKDMKVTATLPDGKPQSLISVRDWDFNWQESYQYEKPMQLPRGTRIDMVAHFDNSEKNPVNPSRPPRTSKWGEQTFDEMCIAFLEVAPLKKAESKADLRHPTRAERIFFIMESRRLAGEMTPAQQAEYLRAILQRFGDAPKP